ncbi:MAG: hypothetical protein J7L96_10875 [Bacteroidales bacterium]|nr:hypothetical protein [Bacteroidales bacterium]
MKKVSTPSFSCSITIGLNRGYSDDVITDQELLESIEHAQRLTANRTNIQLSVKITPCSIVFLGQNEPSVTISCINYPKFPQETKELKDAVLLLATTLMSSLNQNRIVLEFPDETVMFEESDEIDPNIKLF